MRIIWKPFDVYDFHHDGEVKVVEANSDNIVESKGWLWVYLPDSKLYHSVGKVSDSKYLGGRFVMPLDKVHHAKCNLRLRREVNYFMSKAEAYTGMPTLEYDEIIQYWLDQADLSRRWLGQAMHNQCEVCKELAVCGCCGGTITNISLDEVPENGLCSDELDGCGRDW
jgi:hypothetical protein